MVSAGRLRGATVLLYTGTARKIQDSCRRRSTDPHRVTSRGASASSLYPRSPSPAGDQRPAGAGCALRRRRAKRGGRRPGAPAPPAARGCAAGLWLRGRRRGLGEEGGCAARGPLRRRRNPRGCFRAFDLRLHSQHKVEHNGWPGPETRRVRPFVCIGNTRSNARNSRRVPDPGRVRPFFGAVFMSLPRGGTREHRKSAVGGNRGRLSGSLERVETRPRPGALALPAPALRAPNRPFKSPPRPPTPDGDRKPDRTGYAP
jgi:hypothetical protein